MNSVLQECSGKKETIMRTIDGAQNSNNVGWGATLQNALLLHERINRHIPLVLML